MVSRIKKHLIERLAGGEFVSGQLIGEEFGVSRAAIAKHIRSISDMGLDIFRVTGKGYRLAEPLVLLDEIDIRAFRDENTTDTEIEVLDDVDSTNSYLLRKASQGLEKGHLCLAEWQTAGRGRRGRTWVSPFASHLYASIYWRIDAGMAGAMGLSLVAGLAVTDTLEALGVSNAKLKWPNDVYLNGRKLAGVLVELEGQADGPCHAVIGVGLNVTMREKDAAEIDQPWADLTDYLSAPINRNLIAHLLHQCMIRRLKAYERGGLESMLTDWQSKDVFLGYQVVLSAGERSVSGACRGIDKHGGLLLEHTGGKVQAYYGGELSLRVSEEYSPA